MTKIFHLVYKSSASEGLDSCDISKIINKSQSNNIKTGVTGLLLYRQNTFIQLLEGEEQAVRTTYNKILKDSRHSDVKVLIESKSSIRIAPQWSMDHVESISDISVKVLFEVFEQLVHESPKDKNLIMPLLTKFSNASI
jgi:hypothetical protein